MFMNEVSGVPDGLWGSSAEKQLSALSSPTFPLVKERSSKDRSFCIRLHAPCEDELVFGLVFRYGPTFPLTL